MGVKLSCTRVDNDKHSVRGTRGCAVPEEVAGTIGSVGSLFFEPEGAVTTETWQYVGEGKGGYAKVQSYNFVGDGMGTFDKDWNGEPSCAKRVCQGVTIVAILAVALFIVLPVSPLKHATSSLGLGIASGGWAPTASAPGTSEFVPTTAVPARATQLVTSAPALRPRYVCATDRQQARLAAVIDAEWTAADRDRDGHVTRIELLERRSMLDTKTLEMLLDADVDGDGMLTHQEFTAVLVPSAEMTKKARALLAEAGEAEVNSNVADWSEDRKKWCCEHTGIACESGTASDARAGGSSERPAESAAATTKHGDPYDCEAEWHIWQESWSPGKKDWCCRNKNRGCHPDSKKTSEATEKATSAPTTTAAPTTTETFENKGCDTDCEVNGLVATCKARVVWAAKHHHGGEDQPCAQAIEEVIGSCEQCSVCSLADAGCTEPDYACGDGKESSWTSEKSSWCCAHAQKGCPTPAPTPAPAPPPPPPPTPPVQERKLCKDAGCDASTDPAAKCQCNIHCTLNDNCCDDYYDVCPSTPTPAPSSPLALPQMDDNAYDCLQDWETWQLTWSADKKDWCCKNKLSGCPAAEKSDAQPAAPALPVDDAENEPFNCNTGFETWSWGWSISKKTYCCAKVGKGCDKDEAAPPPPPFPGR